MTNNDDDKLKRTLMAKTKAELVEDYIAAQKRHIKASKELAEKYSAMLDEVRTLRSDNARISAIEKRPKRPIPASSTGTATVAKTS